MTSQDRQESAGPGFDRLSPAMGPLLLLATVFLFNFLCRVASGPLLPAVERDLGLGHAHVGSLFLFTSGGFFISMLLSGFICARLTHRTMIVLSAVVVGLMTMAIATAGSLFWLRAGYMGLGLVSGAYVPSAVAILTTLVTPRLWARAMAIHDMAPNAAFILSPLIAEVLLLWTGWRGSLVTVGGLSIASGLVFALFGRGGRFKGQQPDLTVIRSIAADRTVWIIGILLGLGTGSMQGAFNMLPLFLMDVADMPRSEANLLLSASRISCTVVIIFAGWLADTVGHKRMAGIILVLGGAATVGLGISSGGVLVAMVFLQPALMTCFFPPAFAILSAAGTDRNRSLVVSMAVAAGVLLGVGLVPMGLGWLGDLGLFRWGVSGLGAALILSLALVPLLRVEPGR